MDAPFVQKGEPIKGISAKDMKLAVQAKAIGGEIFSVDKVYRNNGNSIETQLGVKIAAETLQIPVGAGGKIPPPGSPKDYRVARARLNLPPIEINEKGEVTKRDGKAPPPSTPAGKKGLTPEQGQAVVLGGLMVAGKINGLINDYLNDEHSKKDIKEWKDYIAKRQGIDPRMGALIVIVLKEFSHPDAAFGSTTYDGLEVYCADTQSMAMYQHRKTTLAFRVPSDRVNYTFSYAWVPPLTPPERKQEQEPTEIWQKRLKLVEDSLNNPPDYNEALRILNGSNMHDILRVMEGLRLQGRLTTLKSNMTYKAGVNQPRLEAAFQAVIGRASEGSDFAQYKSLTKEFSSLPPEQQMLAGSWRVTAGQWTWTYDVMKNGWCRWTQPGRNQSNEGKWWWSGNVINISWKNSPTEERWNLPLNPANTSGIAKMSNGTFPIKAVKL